MTVPEMFSSGLQPERTSLAWRRTVLALVVGSVVSYRVLAPAIGWWSIVVGTLGLVVSAVVGVFSARRGRRLARALAEGESPPGGGLLLLLGLSVSSAAAVGAWYVLG